jgi:selenide,water dikinase
LPGKIPDAKMDILYDAQTSGGLLISVDGEKAQGLVERLHSKGVRQAAMVGEVRENPKGRVVLQ